MSDVSSTSETTPTEPAASPADWIDALVADSWTLADVLHRIVDKLRWFTEEELLKAHAAIAGADLPTSSNTPGPIVATPAPAPAPVTPAAEVPAEVAAPVAPESTGGAPINTPAMPAPVAEPAPVTPVAEASGLPTPPAEPAPVADPTTATAPVADVPTP